MRPEKDVYERNMIDLTGGSRGTPIFEPDPGEGCCGPQIGDVGYKHKDTGSFMTILNIFSSTTTAMHDTSETGALVPATVDVPGLPVSGEICRVLDNITALAEEHPYISESVKHIGLNAGVEG